MLNINADLETEKKRRLSLDDYDKQFQNPRLRMKFYENENEKDNRLDASDHLSPKLMLFIQNSIKTGIEREISKFSKDTHKDKKLLEAEKKIKMKDAVNYAKDENNIMAALKFDVSETTIRRWRKKIECQNKVSDQIAEICEDEIKSKYIPVSEKPARKKTTPHVDLEVKIYLFNCQNSHKGK